MRDLLPPTYPSFSILSLYRNYPEGFVFLFFFLTSVSSLELLSYFPFLSSPFFLLSYFLSLICLFLLLSCLFFLVSCFLFSSFSFLVLERMEYIVLKFVASCLFCSHFLPSFSSLFSCPPSLSPFSSPFLIPSFFRLFLCLLFLLFYLFTFFSLLFLIIFDHFLSFFTFLLLSIFLCFFCFLYFLLLIFWCFLCCCSGRFYCWLLEKLATVVSQCIVPRYVSVPYHTHHMYLL